MKRALCYLAAFFTGASVFQNAAHETTGTYSLGLGESFSWLQNVNLPSNYSLNSGIADITGYAYAYIILDGSFQCPQTDLWSRLR